jgi:hypothetical protein
METVSLIDLFGIWVSIFLTLAIFSFLYDDNPIYKLAENLFLGISIGIGTIEIYYGVFKPNLIDHLADLRWQSFIPLGLLFLLMMKITKKYSYFARLPIAFIVAAFAGVKLTGEANANLMTPIAESMPDLQASWAQYGFWSWENDGAGVFSDLVLVLGLSACLLHFYFSAKPNRAMSGVSKVGITVLMLSFGASFGYTVMGRISLAIGRFQELLGLDKTEAQWMLEGSEEPLSTLTNVSIVRWMTVVTAVVIILIIARWKRQQNNEPTDQAG